MPDKYIHGTIDGIKISVLKETTILSASKLLDINIPTLCHHEGLVPDGNCRLCTVEIGSKLAVSCLYPLREDNFTVNTKSPKVHEARRFVLSLLIARAPKAPRIIALAKEYGALPSNRFLPEADNCIRCGKCVRICKINRTEAISLVGRGPERIVTGPFLKPPEDCIGCLACGLNCPTGNIPFREKDGIRSIWGRNFNLVPCPECGTALFTKEELDFHKEFAADYCPTCRRKKIAGDLLNCQNLLVRSN
ncbi:MAG: (2Fe-2S)-binding protein [Deltaproteobacteria bacterium]|jgi:NADH dehydrogenase/NADH:ubiquinone oxidoreductase subunit G|nr:(2Fe-2S)-binding protein [Deltaproteobacteria bacterium]